MALTKSKLDTTTLLRTLGAHLEGMGLFLLARQR
jgi:hypothetical protein